MVVFTELLVHSTGRGRKEDKGGHGSGRREAFGRRIWHCALSEERKKERRGRKERKKERKGEREGEKREDGGREKTRRRQKMGKERKQESGFAMCVCGETSPLLS